MIGRRVAVGLALLCTLVFSATMASSASAAVAGTTAFTCAPEPAPTKTTKGFEDEHCTKAIEGTKVKFVHVAIKQDESTIIHATNNVTGTETSPAVLKGTLAGQPLQIKCEKVTSHANLTNKLNTAVPPEHYINVAKITIHYTECKITEPGGEICKIKENTILVEGVTATTEGQGMNVKFKPEVGETFVVINVEGVLCPFTKIEVKGSVSAQVSGATLTFSETGTTAEKTLTAFGNPAGLEGKITIRQAEATEETAKTGNPISATTVETP